MKKAALFALAMSGALMVHADQQSMIDAEDTRIRSRMTAKGFACREKCAAG
ncbi:MAG: hypothetical protein U1F27_00625 [Turneriella sp.]